MLRILHVRVFGVRVAASVTCRCPWMSSDSSNDSEQLIYVFRFSISSPTFLSPYFTFIPIRQVKTALHGAPFRALRCCLDRLRLWRGLYGPADKSQLLCGSCIYWKEQWIYDGACESSYLSPEACCRVDYFKARIRNKGFMIFCC